MRAGRLTEDQLTVLTHYLDTIELQHGALIQQIQNLWVALVILVSIGILFLACMCFLAAWSVRSVNTKQEQIDAKVLELAGKFNLLIDILLEDARTRKKSY